MEPVAREYYKNIMMEHSSLVVCETGLYVRAICPFLGASPDEIVSCNCHAERLLEIKYPLSTEIVSVVGNRTKTFPLMKTSK